MYEVIELVSGRTKIQAQVVRLKPEILTITLDMLVSLNGRD